MIMGEDKIYNISNEDRYCYGEDSYLRRMNRENYVTGVEQLQIITEGNSYKSVSKQL